jgi:hypothetical protein
MGDSKQKIIRRQEHKNIFSAGAWVGRVALIFRYGAIIAATEASYFLDLFNQ